jgi:membrane protein required for colicin V production
MNYIDIILGLILLFAAVSGFRKGFVSELVSLAALILGIWGAVEFSYITTDFLTEQFDFDTKYLNIISFIITFLVIVILVHITGSSVNKLIEVAMLGFLNKMAGLVFGIVKSALILSIILLVFDKIDQEMGILSHKTKTESRLYEPVRTLAPSTFPFIKDWDLGASSKNQDDLLEQIKDTLKI